MCLDGAAKVADTSIEDKARQRSYRDTVSLADMHIYSKGLGSFNRLFG
jgi:hypothetical protein